MDIKKTPTKDIHKTLPDKDYHDLYNKLRMVFGSEMPFAEFKIGSGFYVWSAPGNDWQAANSGSEATLQAVIAAAAQLKAKVSARLKGDTDKVFVYPDDSYVFFRLVGGRMQLMIAGWGFRYPVRRNVNAADDEVVVPEKFPVSVSFLLDGERLPDHPFDLRLERMDKPLRTDAKGIFQFDDIQPGTELNLVDSVTDRVFTTRVSRDKNHYDFDITDPKGVVIRATLNGAPLAGETAEVIYNDRTYNCLTGPDGMAMVSVPYLKNKQLTVNLRGQTQSAEILPERNYFEFNITEQAEPEPEPVVEAVVTQGCEPVLFVKDPDGNTVPGWGIRVESGGTGTDYVSDANGMVQLPFMDSGTPFSVTDSANPQNVGYYSVIEGRCEFDFIVQPVVPMISFRVVDCEGNPMHGKLSLSQQGQPDVVVELDAVGHADVPESALRRGVLTKAVITDNDGPTDPIPFTIDANENDYVLEQVGRESAVLSVLMFLLCALVVSVLFGMLWMKFGDSSALGSLSDWIYDSWIK